MKVFLITKGIYSDFHIDSIYSTQEKAENANREIGGEIAEWEVDPEEKRRWHTYVSMAKNGEVEDVRSCFHASEDLAKSRIRRLKFFRGEYFFTAVETHDHTTAIKIVNERRTQILALNQWKEGIVTCL